MNKGSDLNYQWKLKPLSDKLTVNINLAKPPRPTDQL